MRLSQFLFAPSPWRAHPALHPIWALAAVAGIFFAGQIAAFLTYVIVQVLYAPTMRLGPLPGGMVVNNAALVTLMTWLLTSQIAMTALVLAVASTAPFALREVLRLHAPAGGAWAYIWATLVLALAVVVVNGTVMLLHPTDPLEDLSLYFSLVHSDAAGVAALAVGIGAPLSEELMFRGLLLPALARTRLGFSGAAIVATALWAALHGGYSIVGLIEVAIFGLVLSWLLWRTGSLRVPLFCHALYNGLLLLGLWLLAPIG